MPTTLYALTGDALRLQQQIDEAAADLFSDDPAVVAAAATTLEGLISAEADNRQAILQKADAWCWCIDQLRARRDARKARADALRELAAADDQQADALQDRLIQALQKAMEVKKRSVMRQVPAPRVRVPDKKIDITKIIQEVYGRIKSFFSAEPKKKKITFSPDPKLFYKTRVRQKSQILVK